MNISQHLSWSHGPVPHRDLCGLCVETIATPIFEHNHSSMITLRNRSLGAVFQNDLSHKVVVTPIPSITETYESLSTKVVLYDTLDSNTLGTMKHSGHILMHAYILVTPLL